MQRSMMAPFLVPQLYSCVKTRVPRANEYKSQSHEDIWLYKNIFEKLPLNEILGGTFLEIGAFNGLDISNTYFFEKKLDFRGVLIEGHPANLIRPSQAQRSSSAIFTVAICDTVEGQVGNLTFSKAAGAVGTSVSSASPGFMKEFHGNDSNGPTVACVPIQSIIDSTGLIDIDLFSLDVEGAELIVLMTLDFEITNIRVLMVELDGSNVEKDDAVRKLLVSKGFEPSKTSVRTACRNKEKGCMKNEVFMNPQYNSRKRPRQNYQYGSGVKC